MKNLSFALNISPWKAAAKIIAWLAFPLLMFAFLQVPLFSEAGVTIIFIFLAIPFTWVDPPFKRQVSAS